MLGIGSTVKETRKRRIRVLFWGVLFGGATLRISVFFYLKKKKSLIRIQNLIYVFIDTQPRF